MPATPDAHAIAVMALTVVALFLFTRERVPMETTSLLILVALALGFQIVPYDAPGKSLEVADFLHGFGHEALITICALMIVGAALEKTGALEPVVRLLGRLWGKFPGLALLLILLLTAMLSAFMNNTPIVVMLLPILISIAVRTSTPASATLMPMGFATLIGGSGTIIGTSTNLLVVSIAADLGLEPFSMFSFSMPVIIVGLFGILYLWLVAPRLLPARKSPLPDIKPRVFEAVLHVDDEGFAAGKTLAEILKKTEGRMRVTRIQRKDLFLVRLPTVVIQGGDRLYTSDTPEHLKSYEKLLGATLHNVLDAEHPVSEEHPLSAEGQQLVELAVTPNSPLAYRTLKQDRFADRHQLVVMAVHHLQTTGKPTDKETSEVVLVPGDVLLAQGAADDIAALKASGELLVLDGTIDLPHTRRAPLALAIFVGVVVLAATGVVPISVSALIGTALVLLTRCITWGDAGRALSAQVIMLIVSSLALGLALQRTGAAAYLGEMLVWLTQGLPPGIVLSALMLLMTVLSNVVSNNAVGVIGTPIAISIADQLGVAPAAFVLAVMFGANMAFATPIGYQTNLLILNAGGYRFTDFMRVGIPLTIIMWIGLSIALPHFFPF